MGEDSLNLIIWHCSIGTFLLIPTSLGYQMSLSHGSIMSMSWEINHLLQMWCLKVSTMLRMRFLFHNSWGCFKTKSINISNTRTCPGGKHLNLRILTKYFSQEQSYQWWICHELHIFSLDRDPK